MKMYDIYVGKTLKQVCGTWQTALEWKKKYKESGYVNIQIVERDIKK